MNQNKKIISILLEKINTLEKTVEQQQNDFYDIEQRFLRCVDCLTSFVVTEPDVKNPIYTIKTINRMAKECLKEVGVKNENNDR